MRSRALDLERYDTDKIGAGYLDWYDPILAPLVDRPIDLLEIGVHKGGSLRLWRDYFPKGRITGIDLRAPDGFEREERIRVFEADQSDTARLSAVASEVAPGGFDLIIDDASHIGSLTKITFWHLFENHLKPSGLYVIEDWGTGYWDDWPDGKGLRARPGTWQAVTAIASSLPGGPKAPWPSHSYGMVGFIKELIDEQAASDVTKAGPGGTPTRGSRFASMTIFPSIVIVKKRS